MHKTVSGETGAVQNEAVEFVIDVTERKRAEQQKDAALKAKQRLMGELNHRVKNHLLMVGTLIDLKNRAIGDTVDLSDIRSQVNTIATIHDKLHRSDAVESVELGPYVADLLSDLFSFYPTRKVQLTVDIDDRAVETDRATTLGLILNELATNAMQHGFYQQPNPRFGVALEDSRESGSWLITVSQNGGPLPEAMEAGESPNSGLGLVRTLVEQLKGTLEIEAGPDPTFRISIPEE